MHTTAKSAGTVMNTHLLHFIGTPWSDATLARSAATCFVGGREDDAKVLTLDALQLWAFSRTQLLRGITPPCREQGGGVDGTRTRGLRRDRAETCPISAENDQKVTGRL